MSNNFRLSPVKLILIIVGVGLLAGLGIFLLFRPTNPADAYPASNVTESAAAPTPDSPSEPAPIKNELNAGSSEKTDPPGAETASVPAFPGAEGAGSLTPGGRGGKVIEVTTLNDRGPGSLRAALDARGPRIVVFRVAGTIELQKPLRVEHPYLTIAGQTAPGGGITLKGTDEGGGKMMIIQGGHDIVIRYLRIRSGAHGEAGHGQINIAVDSGSHNIIIDHGSFSWTLDENISIHRNMPDDADPNTWPPIYNLTLQRSIMAEGLWPHSTGVQIGGEAAKEGWRKVYDLTLHHNLYANNSHRNPGLGSLHTQVINNVVYNWLPRAGETWRDIDVDWINNYFKAGPMSEAGSVLVHNAFPKGQPDQPWPAASIYLAGNIALPHYPDAQADNWAMYRIHYADTPLPDTFRRDTPLSLPGLPVTIDPAEAAYRSVLADVGANARLDCQGNWVANADAVDVRLLKEVQAGQGPAHQPPLHEDEVGGYPPLEPGQPCADADHDGMPDAWEKITRLLDPQVNDSAGYDLNPTYTNIEVYLNGLPVSGAASNP